MRSVTRCRCLSHCHHLQCCLLVYSGLMQWSEVIPLQHCTEILYVLLSLLVASTRNTMAKELSPSSRVLDLKCYFCRRDSLREPPLSLECLGALVAYQNSDQAHRHIRPVGIGFLSYFAIKQYLCSVSSWS